MKYELGDKVRISACYKRQLLSEQLKDDGIETDLEEYLETDDMAGDCYTFIKYDRENIDETGYIVGMRTIKISADLTYSNGDNPFEREGVYQESEKYKKFYLVATRMNMFRYVDFDDIEYIGVASK